MQKGGTSVPGLPTGTVTFLFTDIEGSTRLLQQLGDRYAEVLATHHRLLRAAIQEAQGQVVDTQGDAVFAVFPRARDALLAAIAAQRAVQAHPWPDGIAPKVRIGLHTGEPVTGETGYVGMDVHRAARIAAAGHGGQVLVSEVTYGLVAKDLPDGVNLRDLGEHRLKDLAHPHRLFQVVAADLPADFPVIKSLNALPNNLPRQLTSFIGREKEMAEVKRLLSTAYLVTLTGSGGAGKTRLALQVAAGAVEDFPDGVWLAEFAPIADPALVPKTVASTLNVPEQPGRDMADTLVDALRPKALLLVLDNCEHLLAACADLVAVLLRACPRVRVLATSREGLGVPGETLWRIPSLSVPDPRHLPPSEEVVLYDAVRLFVDRAVATASEFALTRENAPAVVQVCQRLDGIPLAIELAAARVKVLAVEQIATRLDDRFRLLTGGSRTALPRQQTLRAAMDWSYDLLSDRERTVLRRLSVFSGGWTLEASEAVCAGGSVEPTNILDLLTSLVDKSLVLAETQRGGEARYRLLETIRQYARDLLVEAGEESDVRTRHRAWCVILAEQAARELHGPHQRIWLERLEMEHDNLRAALVWSREDPRGAEAALRLAAGVAWFWYFRGHWNGGREWIEEALNRRSDERHRVLPKVYGYATFFANQFGDYERAKILGEEGLAIARDLDDRWGGAFIRSHLGQTATFQMEYGDAAELHEEAVHLARQTKDKWLLSICLCQQVSSQRIQDDLDVAIAASEEALVLMRETGDTAMVSYMLRIRGAVALQHGHYQHAAGLFTESLRLSRETGFVWSTLGCLMGLAGVSNAKGDCDRAARLLGAAEALREALGNRRSPQAQTLYDRRLASTRGALGEAAFSAAWAEGRAMTLEQAIEYALAVEPG